MWASVALHSFDAIFPNEGHTYKIDRFLLLVVLLVLRTISRERLICELLETNIASSCKNSFLNPESMSYSIYPVLACNGQIELDLLEVSKIHKNAFYKYLPG